MTNVMEGPRFSWAKLCLAMSLPFTVLFFVPPLGLLALLGALLGTRFARSTGLNAAGGWGVLWLAGLVFGVLGVVWAAFLLFMVVSGRLNFL